MIINLQSLREAADALFGLESDRNDLSNHIQKKQSFDIITKLSSKQAYLFVWSCYKRMNTASDYELEDKQWIVSEISRWLTNLGEPNVYDGLRCEIIDGEVFEDHIKIKPKISVEHYEGLVFDYTIDVEHSFVTNFIVHNSYELSHKVWYDAPKDSTVLGASIEEQIAWFLGEPSYMSHINKAESTIGGIKNAILDQIAPTIMPNYPTYAYDPYRDMSSKVDAVVKGPHGNMTPLIIRPLSRMQAGVSELNAFMSMRGLDFGTLMSIDDETGNIEKMTIRKDTQRFMREMTQLESSSQLSKSIMIQREREGYGDNHANMYSRLNRLKILSDVGMYSDEYKVTRHEVMKMEEAGLLSPEQQGMLKTIDDQVEQKKQRYSFKPYRFINQGTAVTVEEEQRQDRIDREYSFMEQMVGGAWERFTHLRTPIHSKLLHHQSVLEAYDQAHVHGREFKTWDNPLTDFIGPYVDTMINETDPLQSAVSFGIGGFLFGNPVLGTASAIAGATYGLINKATGIGVGIPEYREEARNINSAFDAIEYEKNMRIYKATGDPTYLSRANNTVTGTLISDKTINARKLEMVADKPERYFMREMGKLGTLEERAQALTLLPSSHAKLLQQYWNGGDQTTSMGEMLGKYDMPNDDWIGWNQESNLDDIKVKEYINRGLNAHDTGLGWYSQERRLKMNPGIPDGLTRGEASNATISASGIGEMRRMIEGILIKFGPSIQVSDDYSQAISINVTIG